MLLSWISTSRPLYTHCMRIFPSSCTNPSIAFAFGLEASQVTIRIDSAIYSFSTAIYHRRHFFGHFYVYYPILDTTIDDTSQAITLHYIESLNEHVIRHTES